MMPDIRQLLLVDASWNISPILLVVTRTTLVLFAAPKMSATIAMHSHLFNVQILEILETIHLPNYCIEVVHYGMIDIDNYDRRQE
jgi:hypothetical protein